MIGSFHSLPVEYAGFTGKYARYLEQDWSEQTIASETTVTITTELQKGFGEVQDLYEALGWNSFGLTEDGFEKMCTQSWFVVYAYKDNQLVGMGRIISDGVMTAIICGLGVKPSYQQAGIGKQLTERLIGKCLANGINPQLMCVESLEPYYEALGFKKFASGMKWNHK